MLIGSYLFLDMCKTLILYVLKKSTASNQLEAVDFLFVFGNRVARRMYTIGFVYSSLID